MNIIKTFSGWITLESPILNNLNFDNEKFDFLDNEINQYSFQNELKIHQITHSIPTVINTMAYVVVVVVFQKL